ncbi:sn-glycerol-1-phosphate dehydrogenase [Caldibacillus lycopersici]|uniref:Sn-glycerol-1-phosphate dehydrogenase n=1 Tax=Perspicuibacillus lycopersici TaxID=1325689 RepID=A0AAE3IVB6_9BACI|nr:sn-glycerol-1-phosphate dehydrogenase [Perspicuibacillus lycopersici]MCU9615127.1 sn-glycerol-1-phosphate dehydrogenase [Perspicuibacillus lycopersici]
MLLHSELNRLAEQLQVNDFKIPEVVLEPKAIYRLKDFLKVKNIRKVVIVYDHNTFAAVGKILLEDLQAESLEAKGILVKEENGQVIADEKSLVQVFVETPNDTDMLIAVGSGTIHDIVRFVGYKMSIPFLSVPTAASVDGFTSKGAPLILHGVKQTIQTSAPIAVFADIEVLQAAPQKLTAAGFGDILGKYTSLLDWEISKLVGNESYNETAALYTRKALETCVAKVEQISVADEAGIKILMGALIESGLVMQVLDHSRPASGAEHHLSHYWEMHLLKTNKKQLLHGAKVAVATTLIIELYKKYWQEVLQSPKIKDSRYREGIEKHGAYISHLIEQLPSPAFIEELIEKVSGPTTIEELGLPVELVSKSLNEAYHLRDRCTGLLLINAIKEADFQYVSLLKQN